MLIEVAGNEESTMTAAKPNVFIQDSDEIPKATPTFLGSAITTGPVRTLLDIGVTGKSKVTALPEVHMKKKRNISAYI